MRDLCVAVLDLVAQLLGLNIDLLSDSYQGNLHYCGKSIALDAKKKRWAKIMN